MDNVENMENIENVENNAGDSIRMMNNQEDIQAYIKMLQEQMAETAAARTPGIVIHPTILIIAFIIFFSLVGFFSYKLIKSLTDKEKKKEEKKKLKEMKKKK